MQAQPGASLYAQAQCDQVPNYGKATFLTGVCNAAGTLAASGTFITSAYPGAGDADRRPAGVSVSSVRLDAPAATRAGSVTARLAFRRGIRYRTADHRIGLLLVDGGGRPLGLDYTDQRTVINTAGNIAGVRLQLPAGTALPRRVRVYVLSDVFPLYTRRLR